MLSCMLLDKGGKASGAPLPIHGLYVVYIIEVQYGELSGGRGCCLGIRVHGLSFVQLCVSQRSSTEPLTMSVNERND